MYFRRRWRLPIAALALGVLMTPTPVSAQAYDVRPASGAQSATGAPLLQVWRACGWKDSMHKAVRTFPRVRGKAAGKTIPPGKSNLTCGNADWGYRHIKARHQKEWEYHAWLASENWRDTADYATEVILRDPDKVTYRASNDTFCYSRVVYLVNKRTKRVVGKRIPNISVARRSHNIITAIPKNQQCT